MHNFIQLISVLNIGSDLLASTCHQSSYTNVIKCYGNYFQYFNLTIGPNVEFPYYMTFTDRRAKLEKTLGVTGLVNICNVQKKLIGCLSNDASCINSGDLLKIGNFEGNDNFLYAGDYSMTSYECTIGYIYMVNNYQCLVNATYLFNDQFTNCSSTYIRNIPIEGDCPATNDYIKCFDNIYAVYCGKKAGDFYCNVLTRGLNILIPECSGKLMTCNPL
uniref:Secreted protein n=1 Tax=Strongyloides venezuelensis TaxID=75913 RepID=A0A0K0FPG0_STRVS